MTENKTKTSKRISSFLIFTGLLMIVAALILVCYNIWDDQRATVSARTVLKELLVYMPEQNDDGTQDDTDDKNNLPDSSEDYPAYVLHPEIEMPTVKIDGRDYIGALRIPSLDLKLPIISEWSYPALKIAPCRYKGSAYSSDLIIAAHNYNSHFGRIKYLKVGDKVTVTDIDGNVFHYVVCEVQVLSPTAIEEMETSGYPLTLFTCTIGGQSRVTVRCDFAVSQFND